MADFTEIGVEATVKNLNGFLSDLGKMDTGMSGLADIASGALSVALGNILTGALDAVTSAISSAVGAVIDLGKESLDVATEFQSSMSILTIAARSSGESFKELSDAALAVGGDTRLVGVSATGAAEAMTNLYKAGLDTNLIFGDMEGYMAGTADLGGALRASIDLAAASELEMGEAAELAAIVLATFGAEMETAEEKTKFINDAMNNFVMAADASVADVSGLAAALTNIGPTAAAAGFEFQEVNNALAILSTRGIQGAEAGTALKSAIANMRRPTKTVQDELAKWGITLFDSQGNMLSMVEIIGQFEIALGGATEEQKAQAIQTIAGTYGMNALNALIAEGVDGWNEMAIATAGAATIEEQAAAKAATFSGQMEALDGVLETFKIQIGNAILPVASDFVTFLTGVAEDYGPMVISVIESLGRIFRSLANYLMLAFGEGQIVNDWLGDFPASAEPVVMALGSIAAWFHDMLPKAIEFLSGLWQNVLVPLFTETLPSALSIAGEFWTNVLYPAIVNVWNFITTSLVPALQVIWSWFSQYLSVAIQIFTTFWNESLLPTFEKLKEEWQNLQPAIAELWAWLQERVPQAIETLGQFWQNVLLPALGVVWTFIRETLIPVFFDIVEWLMTNVPIAIDTAVKFWNETLYPALEVVWAFISENVIPVIEDIVEWLQIYIPIAIETARAYWEETLKPALETVWLFISENVIPIIIQIVDWLQIYIPLAIEEARRVWEEVLKPALEAVWAFIQDYLVPLFDALNNLLSVVLTKTLEALTAIWNDSVKPALEAVWKFIDENLIPIFEAIGKEISETLQPILDGLATFLTDKLAKGFEGVKNFISDVITKINDLAAAISGLDTTKMNPFTAESPAPLALGLSQVRRQMSAFTSLELPRFAAEISAVGMTSAGPSMSAGSVMTTNVNNTFNTTVQDGVGQRAFENRVMNTVNRAMASGVA